MKIEKLLIFAPLFLFVRGQTACFREIDEDICAQREGFDTNCDARCTKLHPLKTRAECRARQTGTLLSFFGIRSFICTCHLNPLACTNPQLAQQPFHQQMIQQHSTLTPITTQGQVCGKPCNTAASFIPCGWQLSRDFEWFGATPNGGQVLSSASPKGDYLVGKGVGGGVLSTCDGLCAKSSVNLTARVWRSPGVLVELCFKENDAIMCAPVHSTNGALINEIIPETQHFQILFKFSNLTTDETVLIDDLTITFKQCAHIAQISGESATKSITTAANTARMCVGRAGLAYCRQKCRALDAAESSARCLRQKENPLMKKCVCQVRRSPQQRVDGPKEVGVVDNKIHDDEVMVRREPPKIEEPESEGVDVVKKTETCSESTCSFEKDTDCDWADLRMLSRHFNNISVAMKKGDENRYGISRLRPKSYSGLLHKTSLTGPISMSIDIFPSHIIDVRICVQNLRKCQTQTIAARSWNRVSARIKVNTTEKVFVLFYNSADEMKSIAIDNISIKSGQNCG